MPVIVYFSFYFSLIHFVRTAKNKNDVNKNKTFFSLNRKNSIEIHFTLIINWSYKCYSSHEFVAIALAAIGKKLTKTLFTNDLRYKITVYLNHFYFWQNTRLNHLMN